MSTWGQLGFQDAASPIIEQIIFFHDHAMIILTLILTTVTTFALCSLFSNRTNRFLLEGQKVETIWTIIPAIILLTLAIPSLRLLYLLEETNDTSPYTIKVIGHQWYWRYEYEIPNGIEFDSYILPPRDLTPGEYRLLEVDNRLVVPIKVEIRILISSIDVIHSWTVPTLGVKADAIPGRVNQVHFIANKPGVFYGQCSEICGANHRFIPIAVEVLPSAKFIEWAHLTPKLNTSEDSSYWSSLLPTLSLVWKNIIKFI